MEFRGIFDPETADLIVEKLEAALPFPLMHMAEKVAEIIERNRHGRIVASSRVTRTEELNARWATVGGKKRIYLWIGSFLEWEDYEFKIDLPGGPAWRKVKRDVYEKLAPEIVRRHERMAAGSLVRRYGLDLRERIGKNRWGEPVNLNGVYLVARDDRLQAIVVAENGPGSSRDILITKAGAFTVRGGRPFSVRTALAMQFGMPDHRMSDAESVVRDIERQLELEMKIRKRALEIGDYLMAHPPAGRILDFDPRYGAIIEPEKDPHRYFYPFVKGRVISAFFDTGPAFRINVTRGTRIPGFRRIKDLLFALYGQNIPERPKFGTDFEAPPWTLRRFGEPVEAYLLDEDERRDLFVYYLAGRFYLGFGRAEFEFDGFSMKKKPTVARAFRAVFGVDLTPEMTREDVEAIVTMAALRI